MIRRIRPIDSGMFKLDGGAMFGVVPKTMWQKLNPPDENNMCSWALRCLLIQTESRNILVETGMGNKQDAKFRAHFYPHGDGDLLTSLHNEGLHPDQITDVILTHLHFDHCGGAVSRSDNGTLYPTFPNAKYWSHSTHYTWALTPNEREKASFLKENFVPLKEAGQLYFFDQEDHKNMWPGEILIHLCNGHTEAMMALEFQYDGINYLYPADLIPSSYHIPLPYIMAYDIRPLEALNEKLRLLELAVNQESVIILEHDPSHMACTVQKNEFGKIQVKHYINLNT
jgi:glyoxylase-like metal-dependent hydrolase (beta-lactamase superfamily II)